MASKFHVFDLATGVCLHTLPDEKEARRFVRHYEKCDQSHEGGPLAVVAWSPGSLEVLPREALA